MAWNSYPGSPLVVDRVWNVNTQSATTYALQKELRKTGYYTTAYLIDGKLGPASIKAWQRYLKAKGRYEGKYTGVIDGSIGDMTRLAIFNFPCNGGNSYGWGSPPPASSQGYFPIPWNTQKWQQFLNYRR